MSQSLDGNSAIYTLDLATRRVSQLTRGLSLIRLPAIHPMGPRLFSIRIGGTQIYLMDADGRNVKRISFGGGVTPRLCGPQGGFDCLYKTRIWPVLYWCDEA